VMPYEWMEGTKDRATFNVSFFMNIEKIKRRSQKCEREICLNLAGYFDIFVWPGLEVPVGVKVFQERHDA
jgi:hypothetical protein